MAVWVRSYVVPLPGTVLAGGPVFIDYTHGPHKISLDLLEEWLSPTQLSEYKRTKQFTVTGSQGGKYIIGFGINFNVIEHDNNGNPVSKLCIQPEGALFEGDIMLAQKILLETDEKKVLEITNRSVHNYF
jgi:hypothetical protein